MRADRFLGREACVLPGRGATPIYRSRMRFYGRHSRSLVDHALANPVLNEPKGKTHNDIPYPGWEGGRAHPYLSDSPGVRRASAAELSGGGG